MAPMVPPVLPVTSRLRFTVLTKARADKRALWVQEPGLATDVLDQAGQGHALTVARQTPGFGAGQGEQVGDQANQALAFADHVRQDILLLCRG